MDETDTQTSPAQCLNNAHYFEVFKNGDRLLVAGGGRFHDCQAVLNIKSERSNELKISASISGPGNVTETACWQPIKVDCGDIVEIRLLDDGKEDEPERAFVEGNTH